MLRYNYPLQDGLENFIVFRTRPRKKRDGENGRNLLSDESVEIALYVPDALISTANVGYKAEGVGTFTRGALAVFDRGMSVEALKTGRRRNCKCCWYSNKQND